MRYKSRGILIAPFDESKCKGIGYNISPSELCYSVKKKHLLQIHRTEQEIYVLIPPHDTILTLSHEYLQISAEVAGFIKSLLKKRSIVGILMELREFGIHLFVPILAHS